MSRARTMLALAAALLPVAGLDAAGLTVTKSSAMVADQVNVINPKAIPGATVDYAILVYNPNGILSGNVVNQVVISDTIPTNVKLRVADYGGANSGPVEFLDGSLLGTGLLGSGLSYSYAGLGNLSDSIEFYDGTSWTYQPVSTGGYDANVRAIRVKLSGAQVPLTQFRLRFRVQLK